MSGKLHLICMKTEEMSRKLHLICMKVFTQIRCIFPNISVGVDRGEGGGGGGSGVRG